MTLFFALLAVALVAFAAIRIALRTPPERLARFLRLAGPVALIVAGAVLTLVGRAAFGLPLIGFGFAAWRRVSRRPMTSGAAGARRSTVRSRTLEMTLDHDTGEMDGRIIEGPRKGEMLSAMGEAALAELLTELSGDPEGSRLLEAYLDRRVPGWREHRDAAAGDGLGGAPGAGAMTKQQAYEVLGLQPGATFAEIRDAHRRLMKGVHPDHGGSDFLAARINEAKAVLSDRHE